MGVSAISFWLLAFQLQSYGEDLKLSVEKVFRNQRQSDSKTSLKHDIELNDNMEDLEYLNILHNNLKKLNNFDFDFVFYIAGVDVHFNDRLGKLKLTDEGIEKRDNIVIENYFNKKIPLCGVLGGGYNKNFDKLVELHAKLHKSCANYF